MTAHLLISDGKPYFAYQEAAIAKELLINDPTPVWTLAPPTAYTQILYFNIYALPADASGRIGEVEEAVWIGTTTYDGGAEMNLEGLPFLQTDVAKKKLRLFVQAVTELGVVMESSRCGYVDVEF